MDNNGPASATGSRGTGSAPGAKKKRRKRGGKDKGPATPLTSNASGAFAAAGAASSTDTGVATSSGRGGKKSVTRKRRGAGRGGGGGESSSSSSRFGKSSTSPLQLPHVKVTLRNIGLGNNNKHESIEGIVESVRSLLEGAFPADGCSVVEVDGESKPSAYVMAWQAEKESFDATKGMFETLSSSVTSTSDGAPASTLSLGWAYEGKISPLPVDREALLPAAETIASTVTNSSASASTPTKGSPTITSVIDSAMMQMMQECGKQYLNYVGGKVTLDEESFVSVMLAEKVRLEKEKIAEENQATKTEEKDNGASDNKTDATVDKVTEGIGGLSTTDKPQSSTTATQLPSIRIRILSVTPVKKSKRRGDIGGKVQLALYPPDPCLLFKDSCRDAGRLAAEKHLSGLARVPEIITTGESAKENDEMSVRGDETTSDAAESNNRSVPPIPYFPQLSPAERSRAVARSRVLVNRTIEALKIHAKSRSTNENNTTAWEIVESASQKTWKGRPHAMVRLLMAGSSLRDLVVEEVAKSAGGKKAKRNDSRADRYDSTIESSEDYKAFIESKDAMPQTDAGTKGSGKSSGDAKASSTTTTKEEQPMLDEEGRPMSAIVVMLRAKQEEAAKVKAEAKAAAARARAAAAATLAEQKRKEKKSQSAKLSKQELDARKTAANAKREEKAKRNRNRRGKTSSSQSGSKVPSAVSAPPGAVLLKKGGGGGSNTRNIPVDGFNSR